MPALLSPAAAAEAGAEVSEGEDDYAAEDEEYRRPRRVAWDEA